MRVFITGMVGTLGTSLAALHHSRGDSVWGCARNEANAVRWLAEHGRAATLFLGDCYDLCYETDMARLLPTADLVYHCAALKHVDIAEAQPHEAFVQNVVRAELVSAVCKEKGVRCVLVSSDKACLPQGVYGATKLLAERCFLRHGGAVCRLGNLIGSSGSVFEAWGRSVAGGGRIRLTDPEATRYFMPVADAARFVADCHLPGAVVIPHPLQAVRMGDVANAVAGPKVDVTGLRPGETRHQWLVAPAQRVKNDGERLVLCEQGEPLREGLCSLTAAKWDVGELLRIAGVTSRT